MDPDETSEREVTVPQLNTADTQPKSDPEAALSSPINDADQPPSSIAASLPLPSSNTVTPSAHLALTTRPLRRIARFGDGFVAPIRRTATWLVAHRGFWLALVAIIFAYLGQQVYTSFKGALLEDYGAAPLLYLIGCCLIVIAFLFTYKIKVFFRSSSYQPASDDVAPSANNIAVALKQAWSQPGPRRILAVPWWRGLLIVGAALTAWLGVNRWLAMPGDAANANDWLAITYWVISLTLLIIACIRQRHDTWPLNAANPDEYADSSVDEDGSAGDEGWAFANHRREMALVGLIILVAAVLRLYNLGLGGPTGLFGDEAYLGLISRQIEHGNFQYVPLLGPGPWDYVPTMCSYLTVPGLWLFGDTNVAGLRFTAALSGLVTVFFMYLLLRLLFKGRVALIGMSLLAVSDVQMQYSRYNLAVEQVATCWVICFYFLYKGLRTKRYLDFVWAGLAAGFSLYLYPSSKLIVVLLALVVGYLALRRLSFLRDYWSHIALCAFASLIIAAPWLGYVVRFPDLFNARMQTVYITNGGAAQNAFARWGIPLPTEAPYNGSGSPLGIEALTNIARNWNNGWSRVIWEQVKAAYLVLVATYDRSFFYNTGMSLLRPLEAVLTVLGMAYFLWRWRDPRYMLFNIWFWPAMFLAVAMTIDTPDMLRATGLTPAWVAFPAVLLGKLTYELEKTGWFARIRLPDFRRGSARLLTQASSLRLRHVLVAPVSVLANAAPLLQMQSSAIASSQSMPVPAGEQQVSIARKGVMRRSSPLLNLALVVIIGFIGWQNINTYFKVYAATYPWTGLTVHAQYIQQLGPGYYIYFMAMHRFYFGHAIVTYLAPDVQGTDFFNPPDLLPIHDDHNKNSAFLFFPYQNDPDFLPMVQTYYPNGTLTNINYPDGSHDFTSYRVPLAQVRATEALTATYYQSLDLDTATLGPAITASREVSLTNVPHSPPAAISYPASERWEGNLYAPAYGLYAIELSSADQAGKAAPADLYLDGQPWLKLGASATTKTTKLAFAQGWHHISLRAALPNARQRISLRWQVPSQSLTDIPANYLYNGPLSDQQYGLTAEYASDGKPIAQRRVDPFIGFMSAVDLVHATGPSSLTWKGNLVIPKQDDYSFSVTTQGTAALKIDDKQVLAGGPGSGGEQVVTATAVPLTAGSHKLEVDYHWQPDFGSLKLYWSYPSGPTSSVLIPSYAFRPDPSIWQPDQLPDLAAISAPTPAPPTPPGATNANRQVPALVIPTSGSAPFIHPQGVGVDPQGNIFVGQDQPPHVYKFDRDGKHVSDWPVLPDSPTGKARLFDLAVDNQGQVYVIDPASGNVEVYDNNGKLLGHRNLGNKFATYGPNGITVDQVGNLYIANTGGSDILEIDPHDNLVKDIAGSHDYPNINGKLDPHRPNQPVDVTITADGSLYTVDLSHRIIKYSADGKYVTELKLPSVGGNTSLHLANYQNFVYLSDANANGIYLLNTSDGSISLFGGPGTDPGLFQNPSGLATDAAGRLYIADRNNNRVQVFDQPLK